MTALVLCEKKSQADAMMAALGLRRAGPWMSGTWSGQPIVVAWARGHLFEQASPEDSVKGISWTDPATLLPIPATVSQVLKSDAKQQFGQIAEALKNSSECWIATDPDREGEAIGRTILAAAKFKGTVRRLWLTGGMDKPSITKAFSDLKPDSFSASMYEAQRARSMADWQSQILTRAMTMAARHGLLGTHLGTGAGRESVASIGRVQTPTLRIVFDRDMAIEAFRPTTFYTPWLSVKQGAVGPAKLDYQTPKLPPDTDVPGCVWYESEGGSVKLILTEKARSDAYNASIKEALAKPLHLALEAKQVAKKPPVVFSLTTLQAYLNKRFRLSAAKVLETLNDLYLKGYVSYPRTERELLPMTAWADAPGVLNAVAAYPGMDVAKGAELFTKPSASAPACYTTKEMEHHGLMPTTTVPVPHTLSPDHQKVYTAVVERYIQAHYQAAIFDKATITLKLDAKGLCGEPNAIYSVAGERCVSPGWMALFGTEIKDTLPALKEGLCEYVEHGSATSQTKPPPRFTEATLLMAMLNASKFANDKEAAKQLTKVQGIGTPATRDKIIETLFERDYLTKFKEGKGEFVKTTDKGRDLCRNLPANLTSVDMTAAWEAELSEIETLPLAEAQVRRKAFIDAQTANATIIVNDVIARMAASTARQRDPNFAGAKPTPKMVAFARKLAEQKGIKKLPAGVLSDGAACRKFIEENKGQTGNAPAQAGSDPGRAMQPTPKMVAFAESLAKSKGVQLPEGYNSSSSVCKAFLDAHSKPKQ